MCSSSTAEVLKSEKVEDRHLCLIKYIMMFVWVTMSDCWWPHTYPLGVSIVLLFLSFFEFMPRCRDFSGRLAWRLVRHDARKWGLLAFVFLIQEAFKMCSGAFMCVYVECATSSTHPLGLCLSVKVSVAHIYVSVDGFSIRFYGFSFIRPLWMVYVKGSWRVMIHLTEALSILSVLSANNFTTNA